MSKATYNTTDGSTVQSIPLLPVYAMPLPLSPVLAIPDHMQGPGTTLPKVTQPVVKASLLLQWL